MALTVGEQAARIVAGWPELTADQRHAIARALGPSAEEVRRVRMGLVGDSAA